jgi:hypothetical protein
MDITCFFIEKNGFPKHRDAFFPANSGKFDEVRVFGIGGSIGTAHAIALRSDQPAGRYKHARRP